MKSLKHRIPAAVAIAGLVTLAAVAVASASPNITEPRTLHLVTPLDQTQFTLIDLGDTGDSPGDLLVFTGPVLNADKTKTVGRLDAHCTFTEIQDGADRYEDCLLGYTLKGGRVTVQGTFDQTMTVNHFAVTGGTGDYQNVRGQEKLALDQSDLDLTFSLIP
jgi:hypothetical protein